MSDIAEYRNLLGAYDRLEDKSEEEWDGDERRPRTTRKAIPRPTTARVGVLLGTAALGLVAALGLFWSEPRRWSVSGRVRVAVNQGNSLGISSSP